MGRRAAVAKAGDMRSAITRLGRDTAYVLLGFPLAIVAFVVVIVGLSLSAGLLITLLGIPVAIATLWAARGLGAVERARLAAVSDRPVPPRAPIIRRGRGVRGGWHRWVTGRPGWRCCTRSSGFPSRSRPSS